MAITAQTSTNGSANTTSSTVTLPAGVAAGDLLIVFIAGDLGAGAFTFPAGWTKLVDVADSAHTSAIAYLKAAGGETSIAVTHTTERTNQIAWLIPAAEWHGTTVPELLARTTGNSLAPDSGSLTPSWASAATLWASLCSWDDSAAPTLSTYPTNYTDAQANNVAGSSAARLAGAWRTLTASSEDPGAFALTGAETWNAWTLAVRPPVGGGSVTATMTEAVASSDSWARVATNVRTLTEGVTSSDVWTGLKIFARSMTFAVTSSDAWTRTTAAVRTLTEAVASLDSWIGTGGGGIAFVKDGGTGTRITTGTTLGLTVPAGGHAAGNLVVVVCSWSTTLTASGISATDSVGGNTWAVAANHGIGDAILYSVLANALPVSATITITTTSSVSRCAASSAEFSGIDATPFDQTGTVATGSSTSPLSTTTATLAQAAELVIGAFSSTLGSNANTGTLTAGSGYTPLTGAYGQSATTGRGIDWEYQIVNSTTGLAAGMTWTPSVTWYAEIATFKGAASSGLVIATMIAALTSTDAWSRTGTFLRTQTEAVASSDSWSRVGTYLRTLTETLTSGDSWARVATAVRTATSGVTSSDAWTRTGTFLRTTTESLTSIDVWTRLGTNLRTLTEGVTNADVWTGLKVFARSMTEAVTSSDNWTRAATNLRSTSEAVTSSDAWARGATTLRTLAEAVSSLDSWVGVKLGAIVRTWSEAVASSDNWTRIGTFPRTLAANVTSSDAWTAVKVVVRTLAFTVSSSDAWTRAATLVRTSTETVTSSDAWIRVGGFVRSLTSAIAQSDIWTQLSGANIVRGGIAPIGRAASFVARGIASHFRPSGGASNDKPSSSASNPRPRR